MAKVYGVGINDSTQVVRGKDRIYNPFYDRWCQMLKRCYDPSYVKRKPTYKDCFVCEDWKTFSKFKAWMEGQYWKSCELDKDILHKGNKEYSPDTCVFVHRKINQFFKSESCTGVCYLTSKGKYLAQCSDSTWTYSRRVGEFSSFEEASLAYKERKKLIAKLLTLYTTDMRVKKQLQERF